MYRDSEQREFARRMRNAMTPAERTLWRALRADQLRGYRFRRQAAIGPYVVDFACFSKKLVIELDGPHHSEADMIRHDENRTAWLASRGFRVIRFRNHRLDEEVQLVVDEILTALEMEGPVAGPPPLPSPLRRGEGAGGLI